MIKINHTTHVPLARPMVTDADLLRSVEDRVSLVEGAKRVATGGTHTFYKAVRADNGQAVFIKHNKLDHILLPPQLAFLSPVIMGMVDLCLPRLDRLQDMTETMFSHFQDEYFRRQGQVYSGVKYREVVFEDPATGQPTMGIAAPVVPHLGSLEEIPADKITNPREAVAMMLMRGLLFGDYDVTFHDSNTVVIKADGHMSDGTPLKAGQCLSMDFGEAGHRGTKQWDVPFANGKLLRQFPEDIGPALDGILKLDREQIEDLIDTASKHVTGWTPALTRHYTRVVNANLEQLRHRVQQKPQWLDPAQSHNWIRQPSKDAASNYLKLFVVAAPSVTKNYLSTKLSGLLNRIPSNHYVAATVLPAMRAYPH